MTRSGWMSLIAAAATAALAAGWFAVNAPEIARPTFADLGPVALPEETPPLPPAPFSRGVGQGGERLARRPLFTPPEGGAPGPREIVRLLPAEDGAPAFRGLTPPLAAAPTSDIVETGTDRQPADGFQAAFGLQKPRHRQYFGGHLLSGSAVKSDPNAPPPEGLSGGAAAGRSGEAEAPVSAPTPRLKPSPPATAAAPSSLEPAGVDAAAEAAAAVAAAATRPAPRAETPAAAAAAEGGAPEGLVLLGVLLRRGDDRALIRTPAGESLRVTLGDEVAGWRIAGIGEDFVQLRRASQTRMLRVPD